MNERKTKKILAVDSDPVIREICRNTLNAAGYAVTAAEDGAQAFALLRAEEFDLVITDICMPGIDGLTLYNCAVRESSSFRERFLFISGALSEELALVLTEMNLKYLWKPFKMIDLLNCVDALTAKSRNKKNAGVQRIRQEHRMVIQKECVIIDAAGGKSTKARMADISKSGMGVLYKGAPLERDALVNVDMRLAPLALQRAARVVWSRPVDVRISAAGLRFSDEVFTESLFARGVE